MKYLFFIVFWTFSGCMYFTTIFTEREGQLYTEFLPDSAFSIIYTDSNKIGLKFYVSSYADGWIAPKCYETEIFSDTVYLDLNSKHYFDGLKYYNTRNAILTLNDSILTKKYSVLRLNGKLPLYTVHRGLRVVTFNSTSKVINRENIPNIIIPAETSVVMEDLMGEKSFFLVLYNGVDLYDSKMIGLRSSLNYTKELPEWKYAKFSRIPVYLVSFVGDIVLLPLIIIL